MNRIERFAEQIPSVGFADFERPGNALRETWLRERFAAEPDEGT